MNIQTWISFVALLLAIGGNITWLVWSYGNSEKRKLAAERDFTHLRNNQKDISNGLAHGFEEIEARLNAISRDTLEIKIWIMRNVKERE